MHLRALTPLCIALISGSVAFGQLVATPAVPLVGQPITITSLQPDGNGCSFFFELTGSGLPGSGNPYYYQNGYGSSSYTFLSTSFPGIYQATADPGANANCLYSVEPVTFAVVQAGVSAASSLTGQYSFLCQGELLGGMDAAIGSFTADGATHITAGLVDFNSAAGTLLKQPLTGSYTLDSTGEGEVSLKTPTTTVHYALRTVPLMAVLNVTNAVLVADEDGQVLKTCTLAQQSAPVIYGAYLLQLGGETVRRPKLRLDGEELLALNGDNSGAATGRIFTTPSSQTKDATATGTFTINDRITGRTTLTFTTPGESATTPTQFVAYPVDAQRLFVMSVDSHATADLILSKGPE